MQANDNTAGKRECKHESFRKEYDLGAQTGDFVCQQCGEVFTASEKEKIIAERRRKKHST